MYKCIIIDDESHHIDRISSHVKALPSLSLIKTYTNPLKALIEIVKGEPVDLILIDIDMPVISGIELSEEIRKKTDKLVFVTDNADLGIDVLRLNADGLLPKPVGLSKFAALVARLFPAISSEQEEVAEVEEQALFDADSEFVIMGDYFLVKTTGSESKLMKIRFEDVIAIESQQNYVKFHLKDKTIVAHMSLTEARTIFTEIKGFYHFQRSFIISEEHLEAVEGWVIHLSGNLVVTVGKNFKTQFTEFVNKRVWRGV